MSHYKRLIITGPECSGKTTLCQKIVKHRAHVDFFVSEYARLLVEQLQRTLTADDLPSVFYGQYTRMQLWNHKKETVLYDTDLLSSIVYAEIYFGQVPDYAIDLWQSTLTESFYLLINSTIPWQADENQRSEESLRKETFERIKYYLDTHQADYKIIHY